MSASQISKPGLSPELRTSVFYSTMFMSAGVVASYFAIWLSEKGISPSDIGVINSLPVFVLLAVNLIVGRLADRAKDWRSVIVTGVLIAGFMPIALFFVDSFWGILLVWTLSMVPFAAVGPVVDAAAMRMTRRNGTDFATIRAWGTVGHMVVLVLTGYLVVWFSPSAFVPFLVFVSLLRAGAALILPKFRAAAGQEVAATPGFVANRIGEVFQPWFLLPVLGFGLVFSTLLILHVFAAFVWKNSGISESMVGLLLALGAASEAVLMFVFMRVGKRFTARHLILISALVTAVRWIFMASNPSLWVLVLLQLTHGISFGFGYLGAVNFIANWTSEDMAAEAQSLAVMMQQAMSVIAIAGFGYLFEILDARAFLAAAGVCLLAALLVWLSLMMKSTKAETKENGPA